MIFLLLLARGENFSVTDYFSARVADMLLQDKGQNVKKWWENDKNQKQQFFFPHILTKLNTRRRATTGINFALSFL